ncbi:hypothetical protein [Nocardioides lianchengensis]|uniref:Uncharacterized protein n=1 Tax=Nocardioides lianchengensis TaxID=1045774 RepID=A0A1G6JUD7_9ACTN|nr:hypothetical protein [Nocardioides lianchengensis]NYG08774.1 MinD-like ATPase involved in chromosome partitioning or flagellar assembly [Nocardioides lianchengensis]SDC22015.1 hypothetical protein SAMN05421872_101577 [Nocardioides lianchengensis]
MSMKPTYTTVHVQLDADSIDDALHATKVARNLGLQVTLSDGIEGTEPKLIVNHEVSSENAQEIFDAIKSVQKFLADVSNVHV